MKTFVSAHVSTQNRIVHVENIGVSTLCMHVSFTFRLLRKLGK